MTPEHSDDEPPCPDVCGFQCLRAIDLVAGCPPLHTAAAAQPGTNHHASEDQPYDNRDGCRLDVMMGLLESDNEKRAGRVLDANVVCDQPRDGIWPSDHFGVAAALS